MHVLTCLLRVQGFEAVTSQMSALGSDVPLVKSYVSKMAAHAVCSDVISLLDLAAPLKQGKHYPLFLLCLQQMHRLRDSEWLVNAYNDSKLELITMLPECDQTQARMLDILDERKLSFLFPLLRVRSDVTAQLAGEHTTSGLCKWMSDTYTASVRADPKFIHILYDTSALPSRDSLMLSIA